MHKHALKYAARGLAVFPCQVRGKAPVTANGCNGATTHRDLIDHWWSECPDLNIGARTGERFFVVDIDMTDDKDGEASLAKLEKKHGTLPETVEIITGGGRHLWFRAPAGRVIRNSVGKKSSGLGAGIDIRGEGGYVLMPPSVHPSGRIYAFSVDSAATIAAAPEWLIEAASWPANKPRGKADEEWHGILTGDIPEGERNDTLTSIAGKLLYHGLGMTLTHDLLTAVSLARCRPPLSHREIERIILSIVKKENGNGRRV